MNVKISKKSGVRSRRAILVLALGVFLAPLLTQAAEPGVTDRTIRIGFSAPLTGDLKTIGLLPKQGLEAALAGQTVQKHSFELLAQDNLYSPKKAVENANQLINDGVFLMLGNAGTPTVDAALPILAEHKVPLFAPYTGAGFTGPGDIFNLRVSYVKEVENTIDLALASGVKPTEVCGYFENHRLEISGIQGMRAALVKHAGTESIIAKLDQLLNLPDQNSERNGIGPAGFYPHDTTVARQGYDSLKKWENETGNRCRLVVTASIIEPTAVFIGYARYKDEPWIISTISLSGGEQLGALLTEKSPRDKGGKVFATQTMPPLDSPLPIIADARKALGKDLNYASLEGYVTGRFFTAIMQGIDGPITRENFLKAARRQPYEVGGLKVDYTNDNQGLDLVNFTILKDGRFVPASTQDVEALFK